jgi:hypothetical protein
MKSRETGCPTNTFRPSEAISSYNVCHIYANVSIILQPHITYDTYKNTSGIGGCILYIVIISYMIIISI